MKLVNIVPVPNVTQITQQYEMYLAHTLINNPKLQLEIAQKRESYKILDNGAYELGASILTQDVIDIAYRMDAQEVVLPDVMFDYQKTIISTLNALEFMMTALGKIPFNLMAVVQGRTLDEYEKCLEVFKEIKEITTIGIPKKFLRKEVGNVPAAQQICAIKRAAWANHIKEHVVPDKDIHLLGLAWHLMELRTCAHSVRTCDTNLLAEAAKANFGIFQCWPGTTYTIKQSFGEHDFEVFTNNVFAAEAYINGDD